MTNRANVLLKSNDALLYSELGVDARAIPFVKALESFRRTLSTSEKVMASEPTIPVLVQFERVFPPSEERMRLFPYLSQSFGIRPHPMIRLLGKR